MGDVDLAPAPFFPVYHIKTLCFSIKSTVYEWGFLKLFFHIKLQIRKSWARNSSGHALCLFVCGDLF